MDLSTIDVIYDDQTKIFTSSKIDFVPHSEGLGQLLHQSLQKHQGKTSHINVDDGTTMTFDELFKKSTRAAIEMRNLGIVPEDIVTICSQNKFDCAAAFLGATFLGAINASLDPSMSQPDIEHLMTQVAPKMIFVSEECEDLLMNAVRKIGRNTKVVVFGTSKSNNLSFADFLTPKTGEDDFEPHIVTDLTKTFAILFSSGSTGLPKGITLSQNYFLYHTSYWSSPVSMSITSLYWISATVTLIAAVIHGTIRAMTKDFDPVKAWDYIDKYELTMLQLPPFRAIEFVSKKPDGLVSSLKVLGLGGGGTTTEHILRMKKALPNTIVLQGFATTETNLLFHPLHPKSLGKPQSLGTPLPNIMYKVVDPDTERNLGYNEKGELRVKSKWFFTGYYKKDSSDVWDADGYFKTGDISYYDEDHCFYVVDRIKEMFKYKGFHITPVKLETVLLDHPEIDIAVIVGVPQDIDESHIAAAVVPKKGSQITPEEVEKYYNDKFDEHHKIRAGVHFFVSIPMTPTGKINRPAARKMVNGRILGD